MTQRKEILYCSTLCSDQILSELFATSKRKPLLSVQKFHKLFAMGFVNNGCNVNAISAIPVNNSHKRILWKLKPQHEMGITFMYPIFLNIIIIRQSLIFINAFLMALKWCIKNHNCGFIICDVLNVSVSSAARLAGAVTKTPVLAIVTDLPLILFKMHSHSRIVSLGNLSMRMGDFLIRKYDAYVFLTEAMNEVINKKKKPYVIIEGISEGDLNKHNAGSKDITRNILYSGGLFERYGIIKLVEAFSKLDIDDLRLIIYGAGELESYLLNCMKQDDRIFYFGMQPNQVVVEAQVRATLLVNPRSSNEEYTKYSFPSKNIEYMASGTPLVTTALPGIPREYYDYVYVFDDETTTGLYRTLKNLLSLPGEELISKGRAAKEFICKNKNGKVQSAKVLDLLSTLG